MNSAKVINVENELDLEKAGKLEDILNNLINLGYKNIIVDFSKCFYIDSTGLRVLVSTKNNLAKLEGKIEIRGLTGKVKEVFKLTKLDKIFNIS